MDSNVRCGHVDGYQCALPAGACAGMGMPMYTMQGIHVHTPGLCRVYPCLHVWNQREARHMCEPEGSFCAASLCAL